MWGWGLEEGVGFLEDLQQYAGKTAQKEGQKDFFSSFSGPKRLTMPQEKVWTDLTGIDLYWVADEVGGRTRQSFALQAGLYLLLVE